MILRLPILALTACLVALPARADVLVFAAASLKEPLDQIAQELGGVVVTYGGSGTLARQISLGAPADVVMLANVNWMDVLIAEDRVVEESVADFASNTLVLIAGQGQPPVALTEAAIAGALGPGRIATGLTAAVPAGIYAKAALQSLDLWDVFSDRLAEVDNVRAALALVVRGQAPLGIVYRTDLRISEAVVEVAAFPPDSHPPIRYVGAVVNLTPETTAFWSYILSPAGQAVFAEAGFLPAAVAP